MRIAVSPLGIALAAALVGTFYVVLGVTGAGVFQYRAPDLVRQLGWTSAEAQAAQALRLADPRAPARAHAEASELARAALRRDPTSVAAVRALGLVAAENNEVDRATRLFRYAEKLSRRDLTTELWLIEDAVRRNNVPDALVHYDRAMKTSLPIRSSLFPILRRALEDPAVRKAFVPILARHPNWRYHFLLEFVGDRKVSPVALYEVLRRARLDPQSPGEMELLPSALTRLVSAGEFDRAEDLFRHTGGRSVPGLRNGGFDDAPSTIPFDWQLSADPDLAVSLEPATNGGTGMVLAWMSRDVGGLEVARQFLRLTPGPYRLNLQYGSASGEGAPAPRIELSCLPSGVGILLDVAASRAGDQQRLTGAFRIPPTDCVAQWIAVKSGVEDKPEGERVWLDSIRLSSFAPRASEKSVR